MGKLTNLLLSIILSGSCALGTHAPLRGIVYQRSLIDCGVAALAMGLRVPYEKADEAIPDELLFHQGGLRDIDMLDGAVRLGRRLNYKLGPEVPKGFVGVLHVTFPTTGDHHYVFMADNVIYDPLEDLPMSWSRFLVKREAVVVSMMNEVQ